MDKVGVMAAYCDTLCVCVCVCVRVCVWGEYVCVWGVCGWGRWEGREVGGWGGFVRV